MPDPMNIKGTGEGKKMAVDITKKLVEHGTSIISGMAKGIDSYALVSDPMNIL